MRCKQRIKIIFRNIIMLCSSFFAMFFMYRAFIILPSWAELEHVRHFWGTKAWNTVSLMVPLLEFGVYPQSCWQKPLLGDNVDEMESVESSTHYSKFVKYAFICTSQSQNMIFIQLLDEKKVASKCQKCAMVIADIFALYVQNYKWQMHASARLQVAHPSISNDTQQKQRDISLTLISSSDKQTKMVEEKRGRELKWIELLPWMIIINKDKQLKST